MRCFLKERGCTDVLRKSKPNSGSIKTKTITKPLDGFVDLGLKLGNDKKSTTTLTAPGTVGTAVGRDVWSKILGKTSMEKLINKGGCFKD